MTATTYRVRSAHGRIHILVDGRKYKVHGILFVNRADSMCGRADCGAVTSTAATLTHEPANCERCIDRQP